MLDIAEKLNEIGAGLRSLAEPWADTTSPAGRMVLTVFAGMAEFERAPCAVTPDVHPADTRVGG
ncbi:recombinase family protein [Rhodobacter amnigenus]|nr:recombinase family protein [Rhodobacter amnigenus]